MKGLRFLFLAVLIAAALAVPAASSAAPVPVHYTIGSNAQYLATTTIIVPVTLTCPAGQPGFVSVFVSEQNLTNATGFGFMSSFLCTGSAQSLAITVTGTGFTPGKATASGNGCGVFCDFDIRQIQIVV